MESPKGIIFTASAANTPAEKLAIAITGRINQDTRFRTGSTIIITLHKPDNQHSHYKFCYYTI